MMPVKRSLGVASLLLAFYVLADFGGPKAFAQDSTSTQSSSLLQTSTLIPVTDHRDLIFDPQRDYLYITTAVGLVQRYDVQHQTLLAPFSVGTSLAGGDITPDGNWLYVADTSGSNSQAIIHKVNLNTGAVTNLTTPISFPQVGAVDVKVTSNSTAFAGAATAFTGNWEYLWQINLTAGTIANRQPQPAGGTYVSVGTRIYRGADRSQLLFIQPGEDWSQPLIYSTSANSFGYTGYLATYQDSAQGAVNNNGSLVAMDGGSLLNQVMVFDNQMNSVATLPNLDGGLIFDPTADLLFAVDSSQNQIDAWNTNTWSQISASSIGETAGTQSPFDNGQMAASADGSELFLSTPSGVRMYNIAPEPSALALLAVGAVALAPLAWRRRAVRSRAMPEHNPAILTFSPRRSGSAAVRRAA